MPAGSRGPTVGPEGDARVAVLRPTAVLPLTEDIVAGPALEELPQELELREADEQDHPDIPVTLAARLAVIPVSTFENVLVVVDVLPDPVLDAPVPVREPVADPEQVTDLERSDGTGGAVAEVESKQGSVAEEVGRKPKGLGPS